jgi:uncharacterized protein YndB with AHSA1/START domain
MAQAAAATHSLAVEREILPPPEKVWRAFTERALMAQWLMKKGLRPFGG